jgi:hypothetical protein
VGRYVVAPGAVEAYLGYIKARGLKPAPDVPEFPGGDGHWERGHGWIAPGAPSRAAAMMAEVDEDESEEDEA